MPKENKSTQLELNERIGLVIRLISEGITSNRDLFRYVSEKYDISERQIENYISKAKSIIKEQYKQEREQEVADAVMRYKRLIALNFKMQDFREVRNCQNDLNKLLGLNEPTEQSINIQNTVPVFSNNPLLGDKQDDLEDK